MLNLYIHNIIENTMYCLLHLPLLDPAGLYIIRKNDHYPELIGATMYRGYHGIDQVHVGFLVWIRHDEQ